MPEYSAERQYYRIRYPIPARPRLTIEGRTYDVLDCSERGVRYQAPPAEHPEPGSVVRGRVTFGRRAEADVAGVVVRLQGDHVVLHLTLEPIPLATVLAEQRYLLEHYRDAMRA